MPGGQGQGQSIDQGLKTCGGIVRKRNLVKFK